MTPGKFSPIQLVQLGDLAVYFLWISFCFYRLRQLAQDIFDFELPDLKAFCHAVETLPRWRLLYRESTA